MRINLTFKTYELFIMHKYKYVHNISKGGAKLLSASLGTPYLITFH